MADPFSIAGSSVGIVSLGLTVCQGLVKYWSQWKSRESDVDAAIDQVQKLERTLELLQTRLSHLPSSCQNIVTGVENNIASCGEGIRKLFEYLSKCDHVKTQVNWKDKMRAQKQKALYPFRREDLQDLKQTLRDVQQNLAMALETLHL